MNKHRFVPEGVAPMEDRVVLNGGGFKFPAVAGGANSLGMHGAFVLTSKTYAEVQAAVNTAIVNFTRNALALYDKEGGFTDAFNSKVGVGTLGSGSASYLYASGTALAHIDARMAALEARLPYGRGLGTNNPTGGAGLSNFTAQTSTNPALTDDGGQSVAELLETAITTATTRSELAANLASVRTEVLSWGNNGNTVGILPEYVVAFGPAGSKDFGTMNSKSH
ncbi:hypothetical protein [Paludisphaera rhizosphaerae]|uniref:hypothetical protein n=1 Tax=Paludisphaera rhizosphaerae TaxID=2711216 RepID=UPI0013EA4145|nr:hypothetical protein [Paludisphaera rhizosphaerae]